MAIPKTKTCSDCKDPKPLDEFYVTPSTGKRWGRCIPCNLLWFKLRGRRRRAALTKLEKDKFNLDRRLLRFGISENRFWKEFQQGCAICGRSFSRKSITLVHFDHCHVSGAYRGLLCCRCNTGLGKFLDSFELLRTAADYLDRVLINKGNSA